MAEDLGEKTEDPTQKRLTDARDRGQVARSADLSAAIVLSGAALLLYVFGSDILGGMGSFMRLTLEPDTLGRGVHMQSVEGSVRFAIVVVMRMLGPVLAIMALVAWLDQLGQVGWNFTVKPITPKFDRLSPAKGIKNIFSRRSLVKGIINIIKHICIGVV